VHQERQDETGKPITPSDTPINGKVVNERSSRARIRAKSVSLRTLKAIAAETPWNRKNVMAANT
jgi:hypothetical protein